MNKLSLYKGCLEPIVIRLLSQRRMYGYEITQRVKEISGGELQITEGALYPLLHRLEAEGQLDAETEMVNNRPRKYYILSKMGKKKMPVLTAQWEQYIHTLQSLLINHQYEQ